jgi:lysyl-tRNA synthetase class 2
VRYGQGDSIIDIDFSQPFQRMTMKEAIIKFWPTPIRNLGGREIDGTWLEDPKVARSLLRTFHQINKETIVPTPSFRATRPYVAEGLFKERFLEIKETEGSSGDSEDDESSTVIADLFELIAEDHLNNPTFIYDFPKAISPLSKASPSDPAIAERFELFIDGMECANGFSELNDPAEQYQRFLDQMTQRERGDEEAMVMDEDYIRALSYGMPPAAGIGIGIDRFVMLLTNKPSIRDVILFPHMRPERRVGEQDEREDSTG